MYQHRFQATCILYSTRPYKTIFLPSTHMKMTLNPAKNTQMAPSLVFNNGISSCFSFFSMFCWLRDLCQSIFYPIFSFFYPLSFEMESYHHNNTIEMSSVALKLHNHSIKSKTFLGWKERRGEEVTARLHASLNV